MDQRKFLGAGSGVLRLAACASLTVTPEAVSDIEQGKFAFIPELTLNATFPEKFFAVGTRCKGVASSTAIGSGSGALRDVVARGFENASMSSI